MSSLREIKDRIGSVRSTLKITSAMKLVASSKLRKSQKAIEGMRPYEHALEEILSAVGNLPAMERDASSVSDTVAVVAMSSNSSLCGAFNANVIRKALETVAGYDSVKVFPIGRKMADAMRRAGYVAEADYSELIAHTDYEGAAEFAGSLTERFLKGEFSKIILVYSRFVSSSVQVPTVEQYLPYDTPAKSSPFSDSVPEDDDEEMSDYIFEPDAASIASSLLPQLMNLKFYAALLDSEAAEQAARTIAMQTASDNADHLLADLTLEYNKGRQQKITSEILDLVGGSS